MRLYATGVRAFLAWCDRQSRPATLDRPTVAAFIAELLNDGREAATARARQLALRRFGAWLAEEGELDADPLAGLKPPKLDSKVVPVLSDQQLRALLAACQGPALSDRRDEALVRLLTETACVPARRSPSRSRTWTCALGPCMSGGTIVMIREGYHQPTKRYVARRTAEGKSEREIRRCLKRSVARQLHRLLERTAVPATGPGRLVSPELPT